MTAKVIKNINQQNDLAIIIKYNYQKKYDKEIKYTTEWLYKRMELKINDIYSIDFF